MKCILSVYKSMVTDFNINDNISEQDMFIKILRHKTKCELGIVLHTFPLDTQQTLLNKYIEV